MSCARVAFEVLSLPLDPTVRDEGLLFFTRIDCVGIYSAAFPIEAPLGLSRGVLTTVLLAPVYSCDSFFYTRILGDCTAIDDYLSRDFLSIGERSVDDINEALLSTVRLTGEFSKLESRLLFGENFMILEERL